MTRIAICACFSLAAVSLAPAQNQALRVGNDAVMRVPQSSSLEPPTALTLECWVKAEGAISHGRILRKSSNGGPGYHLNFAFQAPNVSAEVVYDGRAYLARDTDPNAFYFDAWHHFAMTASVGGSVRLYIDGVLVAGDVAPLAFTHSSDLIFGGALFGSSPDEEFIGLIDEVRFWNVERTATEIAEQRMRWIESAPGLVSVWHFDGSFEDSAGSNDGVNRGAALVPSDAPVRRVFTASSTSGSWQGGFWIELRGGFPFGATPDDVSFGATAASQVIVAGPDRLQVLVPPGAAGAAVPLTVRYGVSIYDGLAPYVYVPRLVAPFTVPLGEVFLLRLETPPPGFAILFAGITPISLPLPPFDGALAILPPVIELFSGGLPFHAIEIALTVPSDPVWLGQEVIFQTFFARAPISAGATFTLPRVVRVN